jgi:hypothetical protein
MFILPQTERVGYVEIFRVLSAPSGHDDTMMMGWLLYSIAGQGIAVASGQESTVKRESSLVN